MIDAVSKAARFVRPFFRHEQWNIGVVEAPIHAFLTPSFKPVIRWLPTPPRGEFLADPFGIAKGEKIDLFYERYDQGSALGSLHHVEVLDARPVSRTRQIIKTSVHASYPHVFQYDDVLYAVCETKRAQEVNLYRCKGAMSEWQLVKQIVRHEACTDPTIWEHDGHWYLICGGPGIEHDHDLYIWHAETLFGPWLPHEKNPVKAGDRRSRPGGTMFRYDGALYRPAQNAEGGYGGGLVIYRVVNLSRSDFVEELVTQIEPDRSGPYPDGIHTLSSAGDFTLVDGKRHVFTVGGLKRRVSSVARKSMRKMAR